MAAFERTWEHRRGGRSAADEARHDYYGIPPIHKSHWKWLIVTYFFLGGIAGGSYVVAAVADIVGGRRGRRIARTGRYVSFAALVPSPALLILDLGRPERFHHMLRVLKLKSPMSVGVWGLSGFSVFCVLSAVVEAARDGLLSRAGSPSRRLAALPARLIGLLGMGPAFFLGSYTGVLLAATAVPLWTRSHLLIGPLFLTSAVSNATAAIALVLSLGRDADEATLRRLERLHGFALLADIGLLAAMRLHLGPRLARPLERGSVGRLFRGGVVGAGLLAPLAIQATFAVRGRASRWGTAVASTLVLVGGFLLRYTIVMAGRESAEDPQATFELARPESHTLPAAPGAEGAGSVHTAAPGRRVGTTQTSPFR